jgi:hypothetical protein
MSHYNGEQETYLVDPKNQLIILCPVEKLDFSAIWGRVCRLHLIVLILIALVDLINLRVNIKNLVQ